MDRWMPLLAGFLLIGMIGGAATVPTGTVAQTEANVSIMNVTAVPDQPAPGERFTVFVTIKNAQNSEPFTVDAARVIPDNGEGFTKAYIEDPGTIPAGSSMRVPLTLSLDSTGSETLRVYVYGESASGNERELQYPVSVTVREGGPQLELDVDRMTAGARAPVNVTVSNGEPDAIRNLELQLQGDAFNTDGTRRINATLAGGSQRTFTVSPMPTEVGTHDLTAVLRFTATSGTNQVVRETETVDVSRLRDDVTVSGRIVEANGSLTLPVRVQNFGNAPITNVVVSARDNETLVGRESAGSIPPDGSRTVRMPVETVTAASVDITATYEVGTQRKRAMTTVAYDAIPGSLNLTGVSFERENDTYRITGSASNVGLTDVEGAIVRVQSTEGVQPSGPTEEYFIGTVEASNFVTFRVTTEIDPGIAEVPLEVSYLADGERVRRTVIVERDTAVAAPDTDSSTANSSSSGIVVPAVVTLGVLVIFVIGAAIAVRRYDDGD